MHEDNVRTGLRPDHLGPDDNDPDHDQQHPSIVEDVRRATGGHPALAEVMAYLARSWQRSHHSVSDTLAAIVAGAVAEIPGCEGAGIVLTGSGGWQAGTPSDSLASRLDQLQVSAQDGPTAACVSERRTVRVDDLAAESRWPAFTGPARQLGLGSVLCFELFVPDRVLGGLNLYARRPGGFDQDAETVGRMFAAHAAIALAGAQQEEHLVRALDSRDLIGQAKGVLMERFRVTPDVAFAMLVTSSQATHLKLRDVAWEVSTTGIVPQPRARPEPAGD